MSLLKNRKGFSLIELLVTLALVGIVTPLIFTFFVFGMEDYSSTTKYINQQYTVMEVTRYIRQDVEAAKKVTFICNDEEEGEKIKEVIFQFPDDSLKMWKFESLGDDEHSFKGLRLKYVPADKYDFYEDGRYRILDASIEYENIIDNLDLSKSGFDTDTLSEGRIPTKLILTIRPEKLNKTRYNGRNINKNIITEFSVRYKLFDKFTEGD